MIPVFMAAVAVRAVFIVTYDSDMLDLHKPHGIGCVTPRSISFRNPVGNIDLPGTVY